MDWIERSLMGILWLILGFVVLVLVDVFCGRCVEYNAVVVDKHYKAEENSYGVGSSIGANGQVGIVSTSEHESEKFLLMVKKENDEIVTTECEPELYYQKKIGDTVLCNMHLGRFSGADWSNETIK